MVEPSQRWSARDMVRVPGLISLSRVVYAGLFPLTLGRPWLSLVVLAVSATSDVLDGWYARRYGQTSRTGAALDGITDKVFVVAVLATLLVSRQLQAVEALLLCTRDLGELVLLVKWRLSHVRLFGRSANVGSKLATVLQYVAVVAVLFGAAHRSAFIATAASAGALAVIAYWRSEAD